MSPSCWYNRLYTAMTFPHVPYFNCIVQYSLYHNTDIGTMWYCTLPITVCWNGFGCALFWRWVSWGASVIISLIEFIMIVVTIIGLLMAIQYFWNYILGFLLLSSSGSANAQLPGCFCPCTLPLNIGLNMLPSNSFMSCLHSLLGYSAWSSRLCKWLSLHSSVPWIKHLPPVFRSTFCKSSSKW